MLQESRTTEGLKAVIFDLDGVIVDTAVFHYQAWKALADDEGIYFDETINERLKGVSRMDSLNIILERAEREYTSQEKDDLAARKNRLYVQMLDALSPESLLPGVGPFIDALKNHNLKTALCSASKNATHILNKIGMTETFDTVVTGADVVKSKPDPEGVLLASHRMAVRPNQCLLIEDAYAGIEAGIAAGAATLGIGRASDLPNADVVIASTAKLSLGLLGRIS